MYSAVGGQWEKRGKLRKSLGKIIFRRRKSSPLRSIKIYLGMFCANIVLEMYRFAFDERFEENHLYFYKHYCYKL